MFRWQKETAQLEISARRILKVFRSLSDAQVALPGFPSQLATAFVISFAGEKGIQTAVALHLASSRRTAFYLHERAEVPPAEAAAVFVEGIRFAESMGFMLGDLDWQLLDAGKREALWTSLPLGPGEDPAAGLQGKPAPVGPAPEAVRRAPPQGGRKRNLPPDLEEGRARLRAKIGRLLASL